MARALFGANLDYDHHEFNISQIDRSFNRGASQSVPKPVVVVGAQRPATSASADGPANLLAAVRTAASPHSRDRGTLVVMDERILSAREVRKDYPRMGGFAAGRIGIVGNDGPAYLYQPTRPHTWSTEFTLTDSTVLPQVDLVFSYSGGLGPSYDDPPAGVVIATTNTTCDEALAMQVLARGGTPVVTAFPTGESLRSLGDAEESAPQRYRDSCSALAGEDDGTRRAGANLHDLLENPAAPWCETRGPCASCDSGNAAK